MYAAAGGEPGKLDGIDGVIVRPLLTNRGAGRPHQTLYWKKEVRAAIRDGDWKLLRFPDRPAELYDISADPAETNDLATTHPERVEYLYSKRFEWELSPQFGEVVLESQSGQTARASLVAEPSNRIDWQTAAGLDTSAASTAQYV